MVKKKLYQKDPFACLYITCTFKNTLVTLTTSLQQTISQYSSQRYPAKVKRKNNPYVLQHLTNQIAQQLKSMRYKYVCIILKGVGIGRYHVLKHIKKKFKIFMIHDKTNTPFNGCRLPKPKRK